MRQTFRVRYFCISTQRLLQRHFIPLQARDASFSEHLRPSVGQAFFFTCCASALQNSEAPDWVQAAQPRGLRVGVASVASTSL